MKTLLYSGHLYMYLSQCCQHREVPLYMYMYTGAGMDPVFLLSGYMFTITVRYPDNCFEQYTVWGKKYACFVVSNIHDLFAVSITSPFGCTDYSVVYKPTNLVTWSKMLISLQISYHVWFLHMHCNIQIQRNRSGCSVHG